MQSPICVGELGDRISAYIFRRSSYEAGPIELYDYRKVFVPMRTTDATPIQQEIVDRYGSYALAQLHSGDHYDSKREKRNAFLVGSTFIALDRRNSEVISLVSADQPVLEALVDSLGLRRFINMEKLSQLQRLHELDKEEPSSLEALNLALKVYNEAPDNPRYWNDKFYITLRFGLDEALQRSAVIGAMSNAKTHQFQIRTNYGFDNQRLLQYLGVPADLFQSEFHRFPYLSDAKNEKIVQIVLDQFGIDPKELTVSKK